MKRLERKIKKLQLIMGIFVCLCAATWIASWITLIFNFKLAIILFISTIVLLGLACLAIWIWGIYLKKIRKEVIEVAHTSCKKIIDEADMTAVIEVKLVNNYIIWISVFTKDVGILNRTQIVSRIKTDLTDEFVVVYEENPA